MKKKILNFLLKELETLLKDTAEHHRSASYGLVEDEIKIGDEAVSFKAEYSFQARSLDNTEMDTKPK